ncbi:MAG: hypothetical protein IJU69_07785 [Bacteroidales bacterium]|nr:hypothetical protein [Bacteroidales bacterium]
MKKILFMALAATFVFASCNKSGTDTNTATPPANQEYHGDFEFDSPDDAEDITKGSLPSSLIFHSDDSYTATLNKDGQTEYVTGTYSVEASKATNLLGLCYTLSGGLKAKFTVKEELGANKYKILFEALDGSNFKKTTTIKLLLDVITGSTAQSLCRGWKIKNVFLSVSGEDIGATLAAGRMFPDGNMYDIIKFLVDNGVNVDTKKLAGYEITKVSFTEAGTFEFHFKNKKPFVGKFTMLNSKEDNFSYQFNQYDEIPGLPEKGTGKLTIRASATGVTLAIGSKIESSGKTYDIKLTFDLCL